MSENIEVEKLRKIRDSIYDHWASLVRVNCNYMAGETWKQFKKADRQYKRILRKAKP